MDQLEIGDSPRQGWGPLSEDAPALACARAGGRIVPGEAAAAAPRDTVSLASSPAANVAGDALAASPRAWFDCNCGFGVPAKPFGSVFASPADLLDELDFCGVGEALVFHLAQQHESPQTGNELLLAETAGQPRLHPTWAILPPQTEWKAGEFLEQMKRRGVGALRAYPEEDRYRLDGVTFGSLLEELVGRRIPLLLGPQWQTVGEVLRDFPDLTLVVVNHSDWGDDRLFRPLIERYTRLYLDTSNYQLERGLADFVRRYGAERLLYGSGSPNLQMGAAMLTLAHADIPDDGKAAIAGGNLRRLLSEVHL